MRKYKWISRKISPKRGEPLACIITNYDGSVDSCNFEGGPYYWNGEKFVGTNDYGDKTYPTVSYWMYWDDFWAMLTEIPKIENANQI